MKAIDFFNVTLSWGSVEEGNHSDVVTAESAEVARRMLAENMSDLADAPEFDSDNEREKWIDDRINGFNDVYRVSDQLRQDMGTLFARELFGGGSAGQINLVKLGKVLEENRERILAEG